MEENNVVDLKKYLHKKIEPRHLSVKLNALKDRHKNLYKRSFAFASDIFIIGSLKVGVTVTFAKFLDYMIVDLDFSQKYQLAKSLTYVDSLITLCLFYGYFLFCFYSLGGKTIGKSLMKLTVVNNSYLDNPEMDDFKMGFGQALSRTTGYLLSYLTIGILFALPFLRKDQKSLSEILSSTTVLTELEFYENFIAKNDTHEVIQVHFNQDDQKKSA